MKRFILVFPLFFSVLTFGQNSCDLEKFDNLIGEWESLAKDSTTVSGEMWKIQNDSVMVGLGFTIENGDTTFIEKLLLVVGEKQCFYSAEVSHNDAPVIFRTIKCTENNYVFENPDHDFPKRIEYLIKNGGMHVIISGDGTEVNFDFEKKVVD